MQVLSNFQSDLRSPSSQLLLPEFREKAMGNSGKTNGIFGQNQWKFGQTQWENLGKSNEKTRKAAAYKDYFGQKLLHLPEFRLLLFEFPIAFSRIPQCFCPNFLWLLPEFSTAFARIFRFQNFWGGTVPPLPPRLIRLWV